MYKITTKRINSTIYFPTYNNSLVELIEDGYKNFAESIVIRDKNDEQNISLKIYLDENTIKIDEDVKFPIIIINKKWETLKELNIGELAIDLGIHLAEIEEKRIEYINNSNS
jgi:hypothetical protein